MKTKVLLCSLLLALTTVGCVGAPTEVEKKLFNIETVQVPVVTWSTNIEGGQAVITAETNWYEAFDFTPGQTADAIVETGTNIGNLFGVGGIVGTLLSSILGIWAKLRSNTNRKTAAVLAQVIEAGRKIMDKTPQGQAAEGKWVQWMSKHQTEAGVVLEVSKLLKQVVNKESAQVVADQLIQMTAPHAPKPQPKK
jgi:hypothetical protein